MCKSFIHIFLLILSLAMGNAFADPAPPPSSTPFEGCTNVNSCINEDSLGRTIIAYASTLGAFDIIQKGFSMCSDTSEGKEATFADGTKGINCQVPTDNITFDYLPKLGELSLGGGRGYSFIDGQAENIAGALFRGSRQGDKICVQVWLAAAGYINMGCKYAPNKLNGYSLNAGCYTGASCSDTALTNSQALIPISSQVAQCVQETIAVIFKTPSACANGDVSTGTAVNSFVNVQNGLRTAVRAALTLYVVFFGIKIALGQEIPKKGEVFMFLMKAVLVMYFSVGIKNPSMNVNGTTAYEDGITQYIYPLVMNMGNVLSGIVMSAANTNGLCLFDDSMYPPGHSYLKVWDMLDCRVGYYLGIYNLGGVAGTAMIAAPMVFSIIFGLIFGAQILFALVMAIMAVMILSFAVFFVNIYVVSLIAVAILLYFAPLFVPMALFSKTKGYFDSWSRLVLGYAIQPVVIMAFIALMFSVCDQLFYTGCGFKNKSNNSQNYVLDQSIKDNCVPIDKDNPSCKPPNPGCGKVGSICMCTPCQYIDSNAKSSAKPYFNITYNQDDMPTRADGKKFIIDSAKCKASLGHKLSTITADSFQPQSFLFFQFNALTDGSLWNHMGQMLSMLLFLFLFYQFAQVLAQFAADLTGTASLGGMAISPNAVSDKAGQVLNKVATAAIDASTGGAATQAKQAVNQVEDGVEAIKNETGSKDDKKGTSVSASRPDVGGGKSGSSPTASKPRAGIPGGKI